MKQVTFALFVCLFASTVVIAADPTCAEHPIFKMAEKFMKRTVKDHEKAAQIMDQFISDFKSETPKQLTAEKLGVCSQFAGQQTCCSEQMVSFFDKAASLSATAILKTSNIAEKVILMIQKIYRANECSSKFTSMSQEEILSEINLPRLQIYYKMNKEAKLVYAKLIASMNRASLCSICVGVDVVNDYMSSDQVYVLPSSLAAFLDLYADIWLTALMTYQDSTVITGWLLEIQKQFLDPECSEATKTKINEAITYYITRIQFENADPDVTTKTQCSGLVLFNERPHCEEGQNTIASMDDVIDNYDPTEALPTRRLRILAPDVEDATSSDDPLIGVNVFIQSITDQKISAEGEAFISFAEYASSSDSTTSKNKLQVFICFAAILFMFIL